MNFLAERHILSRILAGSTNPKTVTVDVAKHWVPVYLVRGDGGAGESQFVDIRPDTPLPGLTSNPPVP